MDELNNHTVGVVPMMKLKSLSQMTGTTAIMLLLAVPSWAAEQPGLGIANNDSIYIDGSSFKIVPGKGKGDASALIKKLDAHAMGSGMIIFRSGDKLYIADVSPPAAQTSYASDRYGSDRDTSVSAAQAERDWQEWQRSLRQNSRYGSDRYGSDRYGSDRYGSDSVSAAQAEREEFVRRQKAISGYAFAPSATHNGAVAVSPRSGCDNVYNYDRALDGYSYDLVCNGRDLSPHASDRYGSDRDTSVSAAQAARDWQEFVRQNPRYGSDRDTSVSAAQAERDWQEYLRGKARFGSDRVVIEDPEYIDYKLKKIFSDNWTANESAR